MAEITPDMARAELARRELESRQQDGQENFQQMPQSENLGDSLKQMVTQNIMNMIPKISQKTIKQTIPSISGQLTKGITEGVPETMAHGMSGLSGLVGGPNIPQMNLPESQSEAQSLGRGTGNVLSSVAMAAPAALGAESALAGLLPAALARILGAGVAEGALQEGGPKERGKAAAEGMAVTGGLEALSPAAKLTKAMLTKYKPRDAANEIQETYNALKNKYSNAFNDITAQAESRGVSNVPIKKRVFDDIKKDAQKSDKFKDLIDKARTGDYSSLRNLQTGLFQRIEKLNKTGMIEDADRAEKLGEYRDYINSFIKKHFEKKGHADLAESLGDAIKGWRDLAETYDSHPTIKKLVGKSQKVPDNLIKTLAEDSTEMKRVRDAHPSIQKSLEIERAKNKLKDLGIGGAALGAWSKIMFGDNTKHLNE